MFHLFLWDFEPDGNVEHIAEHGLEPDDVEYAFNDILSEATSRSSGRPAIYGLTPDGRVIFVVFEEIDDRLIYVITAFEYEE
ncbi:MAG: hypothetical protein JWM11_3769 [Planctomycetaceae bacterium]|nr:hypothetical protein [Planctomycetaceae bacterium]